MDRKPAAHSRIHDYFEDRIKVGLIEEGQKLPTEAEIAREFGVSRATVQFAMSRLAWDGLIERFPGRGTFARSPADDGSSAETVGAFGSIPEYETRRRGPGADRLVESLQHISKHVRVTRGMSAMELLTHGGSISAVDHDRTDSIPWGIRNYRLLNFGRRHPTTEMQEQLNVEEEQTIFVLDRLGIIDGMAVEKETHSFAPDIFPRFDTESLDNEHDYQLFIEHNIRMKFTRIEVTIIPADDDESPVGQLKYPDHLSHRIGARNLYLSISEKRFSDQDELCVYSKKVCIQPSACWYAL